MKPVLVLAAGGAAILVAGLSGCSGNKSSNGSTSPANPGIPKVTVAGQPQNSQQGQAVCTKETGRDGYSVKIDEAAPDEVNVELSTDASAVWFVSIKGFNGMELHYLPGVTTTGNASATKDGKSYKVTGTISPAYGESPRTFPFEIDFSCP